MKHHLKDAETHIERAIYGNIDRSEFNALLAIAHALVALAERLEQDANFEEQVQLGIDHPLYKDE